MTLRAIRILKKADVVFYDRLVNPEILKYVVRAKKVFVGKSAGESSKQQWINRALYREAKKGKTVVRLKNGDPMVFGRGGEELEYLRTRGIEVEVIPGLTSAIAVPGLERIPLTHRKLSSSLTIVSGRGVGGSVPRWKSLGDTVVILMPIENLSSVVRRLLSSGKRKQTPCALISKGSRIDRKIIVSDLQHVVDFSRTVGISPPAVLVVGEVVRSLLDWRGRRVAAFRCRSEVRRTKKLIKAAGGRPMVFEVCKTIPAQENLAKAASQRWDTLVFMSANGVRSAADFFELSKYRVIAVGGRTREELLKHGATKILVPEVHGVAGVQKLLKNGRFGRVLAFRSPLAKRKIRGAVNLVAYHVKLTRPERAVKEYLRSGSDFTILTSAGLLELVLKSVGKASPKLVRKMNESFVISLGREVTKAALRSEIWVNYEAEKPCLKTLFSLR
jgi:uroporphyrin-III C-methyltransferase